MIFTPFPELRTQRLILRKPDVADWPVVSYLRTDYEVNRFVQRSSAETKEKAIEFIEKVLSNAAEDKSVIWFICLNDDPEMIGSICLWNISEDRKTAEIGYDLSPAYWGKGIMNEAMEAIIKYGFETLALDTIEAYTSKENIPSIELLYKNGFHLNNDKIDPNNSSNIIFELRQT